MALKTYVAAALLFGGVAWLLLARSEQADADRQAAASRFGLSGKQIAVYDKCIGAMDRKVLRAGGSKPQFCGCLTQGGLSELQPDESDAVLGWIKDGVPQPATITDRQRRLLKVAMTCNEDTRSTWSSVAAMQSWCAEKDARRELPQCKHGPK